MKRQIARISRQVKRVARNVDPPNKYEWETWSSSRMECFENGINWRTFLTGTKGHFTDSQSKMFTDADGSGATAPSATGAWHDGAWMRCDQLQSTTFRNNYQLPVKLTVFAVERRRNANVHKQISGGNFYPLYQLEKMYNNVVHDSTFNVMGGLSYLDEAGNSDIQFNCKKALAARHQLDATFAFGPARMVWLQPGQSLTLSSKNVWYEKFSQQDVEDAFHIKGYVVGISGCIGHSSAGAVGYMSAKVDFVEKIMNTLSYKSAVYSAYENYVPDSTVLGATLEAVIPDDPAKETVP